MTNPTTLRQRHGASIGQPLTRADGRLKVTGAAPFAADRHPSGMLHAVMAVAGIASGRVTALDVAAACAHPGVVAVMTPANRPPLAQDPDAKDHGFMFRLDLLQDDRVRYAGQPIAVVIARTLEAATAGAALLAPRYVADAPLVGLDAGDPFVPAAVGPGHPADMAKGDVATALASATHQLAATFTTPAHYHNPMEPHAIVAQWDGDRLSIDMPTQGLAVAQQRIAGLFGIPPDHIDIRSPFLGGGFGSKGLIAGPMVLGILAARLTGRPVKLVLTRPQMYGPVTHRAPTRQTLRLGVADGGRLTAIEHATRTYSSVFDDFFENASDITHALYASDAIATHYDAVRNHVGTPGFMRAPGEATGSIALECAIDEMAAVAGMDPLAFRLANYAEVEPMTGKPFSSKALRECYAAAAERFGWAGRPRNPRTMRDADGLLVGWGMGTAIFPALMFRGAARATIRRDGRGVIEAGLHDMGQGAWTALAQVGADALGLPVDAIEFVTGHSRLPDAGLAGGSAHSATAGMAVHLAGEAAVAKLAALAMGDERSPLFGAGNAGVIARDGCLYRRDDEARSEPFGAILERAGLDAVTADAVAQPAAAADAYARYAHGAVFAEVKVDPDLGQVRVTRLVGAFAAGRVINPRLVDSQLYGGMIWGLSFALHERAIVDPRTGRVMNADLGDYHMPVNADVPAMTVIQVAEQDMIVNPLGIKGVGEIGITGSAGAIANAVWHATGTRPRSFPITLDTLLG